MRARYLIAIGPGAIATRTRLQDRLSTLLSDVRENPYALLFSLPTTPVLDLPVIGGWLVGTLFDANGRERVSNVPSHGQLAIESTGGTHLTSLCSGSYIACWHEEPGVTVRLLRDPSATMPALFVRGESLTVVASDLDLIVAALGTTLRVDWRALAHRLRFPQLPTARTCIDGVNEILPGQRLSLGLTRDRLDQLWKPAAFAARAQSNSGRDASQLTAVIADAVAGWTASVERVGLELSGGLDSSILACALHAAGAKWSAITVATRSSDGDERHLARLVSERFDVALTEMLFDDELVGVMDPPIRLTASPGGAGLLRRIDRAIAAHADRAFYDALLSGTGGDNVFCSITSTAPILDAFRICGPRRAMQAVRDLSALTDATYADVARHLIGRMLRDRIRRRRWAPDDSLLSRDVRPEPDLHPWLELPRAALAGTRAHIAAILRIHQVLESHDRVADHHVIFPLLSQPVLEACLAIPTWQWIAGGVDRAAARVAFAGRLPEAILARRAKGRLDSAFIPAYDRMRREIATLLQDGLLADAGLLDRPALFQALAKPASSHDGIYSRILRLVDAELWARMIRDHAGLTPPF